MVWIWSVPPKASSHGAWSLVGGTILGGSGNFSRCGEPLKVIPGSSLCFLVSMSWRTFSTTHSCCHDTLPKHMGQETMGWTPWNCEPKKILPLLSCSLRWFGHSSVKVTQTSQAVVAHSCNLRYSGCRDQKDQGSKLVAPNSSGDPILKNIQHKKGLAEWFTCLLSMRSLIQISVPRKQKN
jgi:hypothetical protein